MTFGPYHATVVNVHDGDTLDVDVLLVGEHHRLKTDTDLGFHIHRDHDGVWLRRQPVRLAGCNAAELATDAGKQALAFMLTEVKPGDQVQLVSHGFDGLDKYGRCLGSIVLADGRDLSAVMIAAGQAAPWDGKGAKPVPGAAA